MKISLRSVSFLGVPRGASVDYSALTLNTAATGLMAWYDASQLVLNDGDLVATWTDKSTPAGATVTSSTTKPTYKTNIVNGKPIVRFTASVTSMARNGAVFPTGDTTVVIVLNATTDVTNPTVTYPIGWGSSGAGSSAWFYVAGVTAFGGSSLWGANNSADSGPNWGFAATCYNAFHVLVCTKTGTSWKWYRDNVTAFSKTMTTNTTNTGSMFIGCRPGPTEFFTGDIAEIGVYNRVVSSTELSNIIGLLGYKYGLTVTP